MNGWKQCRRQQTTAARGSFATSKDTNPLLINTKITNNVILFRYDKPWVYKVAFGFGCFATLSLLAMADLVYKALCTNLFNSAIDWKARLYAHAIPLTAIAIGVFGGKALYCYNCNN